jgi:putative DNA-invertase from lambdoid prophage Rac
VNAAVYLRVSTEVQTEANQEPDCLRLCMARGWSPVLYRERVSGASRERPEWRRVLESARKGEVGAVVFWALDRAGRDRVQLCHDLSELARWRVALASVQDAWLDQPAGPLRDLLLQILAWVAEGERSRLIERTKAGQARARLQGKIIGRPRRKASDIEAVARLRFTHTPTQIAAATGIPRTTVRAILQAAKNGSVYAPGQPAKIRGL